MVLARASIYCFLQLYDLYYKNLQGAQSGENGCPREDSICGTTCGTNGTCSASFTSPAVQSCVCKPGFRGSNCNTGETPLILIFLHLNDFRGGTFFTCAI